MGTSASVGIAAAVANASDDDLKVTLSAISTKSRDTLISALSSRRKSGAIGVEEGGTLLQAKSECFKDAAVDIDAEQCEAKISSFQELLGKHQGDEALQRQTENIIKKCGSCGKVNAYTLLHCNSCGSELPSTTGTSPNIFTAFIYGVGPFKISIRHQTPEVLVLDDLMACTPCHFNAIPTAQYIQDWRFLLKKPAEALSLIDMLYQSASGAFKRQFGSNDIWRGKVLSPDSQAMTVDELAEHAKVGFNFPPSQYQLHLQYMVPPFVPYQIQMISEGKGFKYGRFFPFAYVVAVLQKAAEGYNLDSIDSETQIENIITYFDSLGVSYKSMHDEFAAGVMASQEALANWRPEDFELRLKDGKLFDATTHKSVEKDFREVLAVDKCILQNYGRPYDSDDKPTGTFYKYAKTERICDF